MNRWGKFKPVKRVFKPIPACSLGSVLHCYAPTDAFSSATLMRPFHKIKRIAKPVMLKSNTLLGNIRSVTLTSVHWEPLCSSREMMMPRVQHPTPKQCSDTTEYSSHIQLLWPNMGQCCIRDVGADEGRLYGELCHAWERLVGDGRSGLWNTQMF